MNDESDNLRLFLGVDGGQSHTEAVVADGFGRLLGRGLGGPSNHADQPGGRERLLSAIENSVGKALSDAGLASLYEVVFTSAHFGMTGGSDYKEEIIGKVVQSNILTVGHDAPAALAAAISGEPGIVVISGTGSVIYGENEAGESARAGGLGFLFSDDGSGFWLAAQVIRLAIKEQDGIIGNVGLLRLVLDHFGSESIRRITTDFYNGKISRDEIAAFARPAHDMAVAGNRIILEQIQDGAGALVAGVRAVAKQLSFAGNFDVSVVGGMFGGELMRSAFQEKLSSEVTSARFCLPRFKPAIGSLLIAYRHSGMQISKELLTNLEDSNSI